MCDIGTLVPMIMVSPQHNRHMDFPASRVRLAEVHRTFSIVVQPRSILGTRTTSMSCSKCRKQIETKTQNKAGIVPWISAGVIALMGGICGCCLIPFFMDSCMDVEHSCPDCGTELGIQKAFKC